MSEVLAPQVVGRITHLSAASPSSSRPLTVPVAEPPLSPRMRLFVIGVRAALLLLCDALGELAGLPKRT